ncbi:MAG: phage major capsid protein [Oscillospiraceae bacterium]|nr:phage major capsid protein [Oscillospiraceae bacterium]
MNPRVIEINNRLAAIDERRTAIAAELETENADLDTLGEEVRTLNDEYSNLQAEKRSILISEVSAGGGVVVRRFQNPAPQNPAYNASSPEYRTAWLKNMARDHEGHMMFGEMSREERAAFTFTTENTGAVVPTDIQNRIVELVESESPILADATTTSFTRGFGVPRHKSIDAGDASEVVEGEANADDEQDTFDLLSLDGVEIKKHIVLTRKMEIQSLSAFEDWLVTHLAARIRVAKERHILSRLDNETYGIATENKISGTLSDSEVRRIFSLLRGSGSKVIYASQSLIWNTLVGLKDDNGEKLFVPDSMGDPMVAGRIYGATIKQNDNLPDTVLYAGYPKAILSNNFENVTVVSSLEPKTLKRIFTGYSLYDAGLENPMSFVKYTVG